MGKGKKADVQFLLPEQEPEHVVGEEVDEYLETPYTSILMSTASGEGCARHHDLHRDQPTATHCRIVQPRTSCHDSPLLRSIMLRRAHRLYTAMAKVAASFEIIAHDQNGERRPVGGDPFSVSVRGAAYVYAKVVDKADGSYRVEYKPSTSGAYTIAITLHGVPMPGRLYLALA